MNKNKRYSKSHLSLLAIVLVAMALTPASAQDSVRIEMPDNVASGEMFKVVLIIDDPLVRELTRTIDITRNGGRILLKMEGDINNPSQIEYAGQERIVFDAVKFSGFQDGDEESTLIFQFFGNTGEIQNKYPDWKPSYPDYIVKISKKVHASPVSFSVETPEFPNTETSRFETDYWDKVIFTPVFRYVESDYYARTSLYRGDFSRGTSYFTYDGYLVERYFSKEDLNNPPENTKVSSYSYGTFGQEGASIGYYSLKWSPTSKVTHKDPATLELYDVYDISVSYTYAVLINDFLLYHGNIIQRMKVKESEIEDAVSEFEEECHRIVMSQKYTPIAMGSGTHPPILETNLPVSGKKSVSIYGYVVDADGNPMPYAQLTVKVKGETFKGSTDKDGDFRIPLTIELNDKEDDVKVQLWVDFNYERDGKNYFKVYDLSGSTYESVWYHKEFRLKDHQDIEANIRLNGAWDNKAGSSTGQLSDLKSLSVIYAHMHEAVDFCLVELKADVDYRLPVKVLVGNTDDKTLYSPSDARILISRNDAGYSNSNRPKNREYHEFAHHLMYATYGGWTHGSKVSGTVNHNGFINPNTGDSYEEGFAEFIALAISDKYGDSNPADGVTKPEIYASFGSLENNYRPWDSQGDLEEFAVASLLWDLYDSNNEEGDSITMSLENIWSVLKVQRNDFYDYYLAFKQANPSKADDIDRLFIEHGFFADTTEGNSMRDSFEGFIDANNNNAYDVGEYFFDLGCLNSTNEIQYRKGMIVGRAANYERLNRSTAVRLDGAYLKVSDKELKQYLVKVHYTEPGRGDDYEYVVDLRDGLLYVQPLPGNVHADISITPYSVEYAAKEDYTISNQELNSRLEQPGKYFDSHKFSLKKTGAVGDIPYETYKDTDPVYAYEGDLGEEYDLKIADGTDHDDSDRKFPLMWLLLPLLGVGLIVLGKKNARVGELSRRGVKEFNEKGLPAIKEGSRKAAELTVKGTKELARQSKVAYEQTKPHLKKAQEQIKEKVEDMREKKDK
ncbi:hypothetical protein Mpsy_1117 [Methanolobus psychrophilus R15]|nr:hypothetical protein Mpsy_1117 [Methanolobus psychrophilus R15]